MIGSVALALAVGIAGQGWPDRSRARLHVLIIATIAGLAYTIFSEWLNVEVRQSWAYSDLMPRLPPLGTGLAPVMQWLLLPGLALTFVTKRIRRSQQPERQGREHLPRAAPSTASREGRTTTDSRPRSPARCAVLVVHAPTMDEGADDQRPDAEPSQSLAKSNAEA